MELEFEEIGLRLEQCAAYGLFSGSFSVEWDDDYETAFIESIVLEGEPKALMILSYDSPGDKGVLYRLLSAELMRAFDEEIAAYERERRWAGKPARTTNSQSWWL